MGFLQKWSRRAVDSVKTAAKETTKEEAKEKLDILWDVVKVLAIFGITVTALRHTAPVQAVDILPQPVTRPPTDTVVNIFLSTTKGGDPT